MGAKYSSMQKPLDIGEFRKIGPCGEYDIPEKPEKRKLTDKNFLIIFAATIVILIPFLIYTMVHSDILRYINGYDKCGNVCGENNTMVDGIHCSGIDMTKKTFLQYVKVSGNTDSVYSDPDSHYDVDKCVTECDSNYIKIVNRCFPGESPRDLPSTEKLLNEINRDLKKSASSIVLMCFVGLGICFGTLMLFRYFTSITVWVILIGSVTGLIIFTVFLWIRHGSSDAIDQNKIRTVAIFFTVISTVFLLLLVCMFKRINLIIRLMKESIKIIFRIPAILCEPILTFIVGISFFGLFVYFLAVMSTAGFLKPVTDSLYTYEPTAVMIFTWAFAVFVWIWLMQFIIGCQHMVISGAVSSAYFTRDLQVLNSPIYYSFYNVIRFHLGTVAFGSFVLTVIAVIKSLIRSLSNNRQTRLFLECCLNGVEEFLKYLSKNAYIQTAMHGQSFYKSGKRAVQLLAANAVNAIAVNSVGDFVLSMAKVYIVLLTVGFGFLIRDPSIEYFWVAIIIAAFITVLIADCAFSVFETAIDTIFLCFCEDNCMNDGIVRPYYMTVDFKKYMDDAKVAFKEKK